ncbi:MAG: VOC family protein [Halobacteriaceae archaeon]
MLHHVGVATPDAAATAARYDELLDLAVAHEERLADRNLQVVYLGERPYLELLEPTGPGPVERFLERGGSGLHHLAFGVEDLPEALAAVRQLGLETVDDEPRPGGWGHDVAFLHPSAGNGVLLELVEE